MRLYVLVFEVLRGERGGVVRRTEEEIKRLLVKVFISRWCFFSLCISLDLRVIIRFFGFWKGLSAVREILLIYRLGRCWRCVARRFRIVASGFFLVVVFLGVWMYFRWGRVGFIAGRSFFYFGDIRVRYFCFVTVFYLRWFFYVIEVWFFLRMFNTYVENI